MREGGSDGSGGLFGLYWRWYWENEASRRCGCFGGLRGLLLLLRNEATGVLQLGQGGQRAMEGSLGSA